MPNERTRSVLNAYEFLAKLSSPYMGGFKKIPAEVRAEARRLLRHFPRSYDIHTAAKAVPEVFSTETTLQWFDDR